MSSRTSAFLFHIVSQGKWGLDLNLIQHSHFLHGENWDLEKLVHLPKIHYCSSLMAELISDPLSIISQVWSLQTSPFRIWFQLHKVEHKSFRVLTTTPVSFLFKSPFKWDTQLFSVFEWCHAHSLEQSYYSLSLKIFSYPWAFIHCSCLRLNITSS